MSIKQKFTNSLKSTYDYTKNVAMLGAAYSLVSFGVAQFHRTKATGDIQNDKEVPTKNVITPQDNYTVYNYLVQEKYFDEMDKNLVDAFENFNSEPQNLADSANIDHYKLVHLDLGDEINIDDALKQAAVAKKDTLIIESDRWLTSENEYCILPVSKVLAVKKHNLESQTKLGLKDVALNIYNTRLFGTHAANLPLSLNVDPKDLKRSTACINFVLDHETAHARQTVNDPSTHFYVGTAFYADLASEMFGHNFKNENEDDADVVAAKLDKQNVSGALEFFLRDGLEKCQTNDQRIKLLDNLYKEKPTTHSTSIQRVTNVLNAAENRGLQ